MPNVTLQIDAEGAKAIRELLKLAQAQDKVEGATGKAARASRDQKKELDNTESGFNKVAASMARMASGVIGITAIVGALREYEGTLRRINEQQHESAQSLISLAMLLPPGKASEVYIERAKLQGAQLGVKAAPTMEVFQRAVSAFGPEGAPKQVEAALNLGNIVGDVAYAKESIGLSQEVGLTPKEFAGLMIGMAAASQKDERTFTDAAKVLPLFRFQDKADPTMGFAAMAAMSGQFSAEQLGTFTQALGLTVTSANPVSEKIKGFKEMSGPERLEAMRKSIEQSEGDLSFESVQAAGITEIRQARSMAAVFQNYDLYQKLLKEGEGYKATQDPSTRLAQLETDYPDIKQEMTRRRGEATAEYFQTTTATPGSGQTAQRREIEDRALAAGAEYSAINIGPEGRPAGVAGWFQRRWEDVKPIVYGASGIDPVYGTSYQKPTTEQLIKDTEAMNRDLIERQTKALESIDAKTQAEQPPSEVSNRNAQIEL